jgi:hypothetical protein
MCQGPFTQRVFFEDPNSGSQQSSSHTSRSTMCLAYAPSWDRHGFAVSSNGVTSLRWVRSRKIVEEHQDPFTHLVPYAAEALQTRRFIALGLGRII